MITIDLSGKNALITGGTRGIGRAISRTLAQAGASTAAVYHADEATAQTSLAERHAFDLATHHNYQADLADAAQIARLADADQDGFRGPPGHPVHNAAAQGGGHVQDFPPEQWQRMLDVNLTAAYLLARALLPLMPRGGEHRQHRQRRGPRPDGRPRRLRRVQGRPDHVHRGPGAGRRPRRHPRQRRLPRRHGHRPNTPAPALRANALRRRGVAQDVASVVLFLCSDLAAFVTGQAIRVNGGAV